MSDTVSTTAKTPPALLCFPALFKPRQPREGQAQKEPRYEAIFVFDKKAQASAEFADMKKAILAAIESKWPGRSKDRDFLRGLKLPLRKNTDRRDDKGVAKAGFEDPDGVFVSAWAKPEYPPPVVGVDPRQAITDPAKVWAGQIVRAEIRAFPFENSGNRGVAFNLNAVQVLGNGDRRLDNRGDPTRAFDDDVSKEAMRNAGATGGGSADAGADDDDGLI